MLRSIQVLEIIADCLGMPKDAHLNEILAAMFMIDENNEIRDLLVKAGVQDLIEKFKADGVIS